MTDQLLTVTATTAVALTKKQQQTILDAIQKKHQDARIELREVVDPAVIGGIRLTVGSLDFDATFKSKLNQLKYHLKENAQAE